MKQINIIPILVKPENPDNIGAVARAVKNTGFSGFRLVRPPANWRVKGKKMAMSAADLLKKAKVFPSLEKAMGDLNFVVGTTRRSGTGRGFFVPFRETIARLREDSERLKVGIVFGCESKGLANHDSALCDQLMTLPSSARYPSMNLAQAVMVTLFTLALPQEAETRQGTGFFLNKSETENTLRHFEQALKALDYKKEGNALRPRILQTLRGLLKRSGLLAPEAQMIKGLSRRIREKVLSCKTRKGRITQKES